MGGGSPSSALYLPRCSSAARTFWRVSFSSFLVRFFDLVVVAFLGRESLTVSAQQPEDTIQLFAFYSSRPSRVNQAALRWRPFSALVMAGLECSASWKEKQDGQKKSWQMSHVSVWDSHISLPQSEHCLLPVFEHG